MRCRSRTQEGLLDWIETEKGPMPPERCLVYDDHRLVLGDVARARPGVCITAAELAGYGKTATRLYALLRPWPWLTITPLAWRSPEQLLLHLGEHTALIYDLVQLASAGGAEPQRAEPRGAAPLGSAPLGSAPLGFAPVGFAPVGFAPVGLAPVGLQQLETFTLLPTPLPAPAWGGQRLHPLLFTRC